MARYAARRFDNLAHRKSLAVTNVVDHLFSRLECFERKHMRLRQVLHVDVVADAGTVRRGVILAEDLDIFAPSEGYIEDQWYQMRFRFMRFSAPGNGAGD